MTNDQIPNVPTYPGIKGTGGLMPSKLGVAGREVVRLMPTLWTFQLQVTTAVAISSI